jgi:5-methylcytosine-specific restriction enzyme A
MARLPRLTSSIASLPRTIPSMPRDGVERSRLRDRNEPWRAWYKTARWQRLRWDVLTRDLFTCKRCGQVEAKTSQLVCDHVERHGGDEVKFWAGPFQTLCKPCHDRDKQREERGGGGGSKV